MKAKALRELSRQELDERYRQVKEELFQLRFRARSVRVETPHRFRQLRRTVARVLTVLWERDHGGH